MLWTVEFLRDDGALCAVHFRTQQAAERFAAAGCGLFAIWAPAQ